ncbi:zinc finger BED domain-containing protein RICESLEEPER 2-like isoform X2 [Corylus avellana]|uniref:zinc finger BED domain-containing protein RICESLEEPER 2-like isoform X2 n=1 Tax=Corylus avellana TaxID=13451 RepID=UPI00286D2528|nr:zinc finger BED domain-containing protein RICESLEEPER 2-like isoform X2 [Corylus avellana]
MNTLERYYQKDSKKKRKVLAVDVKESNGVSTISNFTYDPMNARELCSHMILYHEYPFTFVEDVLFNKLISAITPHWETISWVTAKSDCFATYELEKKKLKTLLRGVLKVNITTDMWTSGEEVSYMVVTCHFIDSDWHLHRHVLNLCNVSPPHTGVLIADALQKCFQDWEIENKIYSITVDNARENDVAMRILKNDFNLKKSLSIGGNLFHVRCCAHITNLLVQDSLGEIGDIIDCIREGIQYLVASEGRLKQFIDIAKQLQLTSKKLVLDVPTRWNSTYLMLVAALEFKEVFSMYKDMDTSFHWALRVDDWVKVENVCQLLQVFNNVTNIILRSDYPTANLFLFEVWRMKQVLAEKCRDQNENIKSLAQKMNAKFEKYWGECSLLMAIAAVLDPSGKMRIIRFCFPLIYQEPEATTNIEFVLTVLHELYNEYVKEHNSSVMEQNVQGNACESSSNSNSISMVGGNAQSGKARFRSFLRTVQPIKSELQLYLEEGLYICDRGSYEKFNALDWWKANTSKFRILSKLARDILSIPITTVSSESTFSAGGKVLDPYRASLSAETVQMLICGADWVRALYELENKSIDPTEEDPTEEDPTEFQIVIP